MAGFIDPDADARRLAALGIRPSPNRITSETVAQIAARLPDPPAKRSASTPATDFPGPAFRTIPVKRNANPPTSATPVATLAQSFAGMTPESGESVFGTRLSPTPSRPIDHRSPDRRRIDGYMPQEDRWPPLSIINDLRGKAHAAPLTGAGLLFGYLAGIAQEFAGGPNVHLGSGNNAIQFTGFTGGKEQGLTLGNTQLYGALTTPKDRLMTMPKNA